jgi:hypothetical protein
MRHYSWKAFLSMVLLVIFFVALNSVIVYAVPPIADPNGPYAGTVDVPVPFDGSGSFDPDPGDIIVQYIWDFGDGTVETSMNQQEPIQFC